MKNCIILGSGRSGTSLLAGSLGKSGYYMGDHLYSGNESNPKGFFEDAEINGINEDLLYNVTPYKPGGILGRFFPTYPGWGQRWLATVQLGTEIPCIPAIARRIAAATDKKPFCFKDPRFCYTLPAWRPFLKDAVFLCVFREPARTAHSIVKECKEAPYMRGFAMDFTKAVVIWTLMYRHVLQIHRYHGEWLFLHYDQVLDGSAAARLETILGARVDRDFADLKLKRSQSNREVTANATIVYERLCDLAGYSSNTTSRV